MSKYKDYIYLSIIVLLIIISGVIYYFYYNKPVKKITEEIINECEKEIVYIKAEIKGAVLNPGVYEITEEQRINDLIIKAGGLTKYADTSNINLAEKLKDELSVKVYTKEELKKVVLTKEVIEEAKTTLISINKATIEMLDSLPGIGEATAQKIIDYRLITPFTKIEDITNVSGIGDALFAKIKDLITI